MALLTPDSWQSGKTLSQSARFMFENNIATDITFTFPNTSTTFATHRFVLMARSPVFYVMLNSSLDKPGEDIEISDIEPATLKQFLRYLYSDETKLSTKKALQLTYCAEKYEVTDLKAKCMDFLKTKVNKSTVAMILDHAVLYNDDMLISTCRDIIEPLESLSCLEEQHATKATMELLLGFQGLVVGELDIFKFCNTWAEEECTIQEIPVNASNRRKMLGPLLRKIPFCSMTHEQFATEVSGKHLLNGQEELQIFRYLCAPDGSTPPFPCKTKLLTKETLQLPSKSKEMCKLTNWTLKTNHIKHFGKLNCMTISPDSTLCASGGKDGQTSVWDLNENRHLIILAHSEEMINALCFSPTRYWVCAATGPSILVMDLESKVVVHDIRRTVNRSRFSAESPECICLTWSADGNTLFAGYTNKLIRVWQVVSLTHWHLKAIQIRQTGHLTCMAVSPDGSLCASTGRDGKAMLWDMNDNGKHLHTQCAGDTINALCFAPKRYWLCAAIGPSITIWDLTSKDIVDKLSLNMDSFSSEVELPECICLAWSSDGQSLHAGYTDNLIRIWQLSMAM